MFKENISKYQEYKVPTSYTYYIKGTNIYFKV